MSLNKDSVLYRISVRRLILEIRRSAKVTALGLLFEQNTEDAQRKFTSVMKGKLKKYKRANAILQYKVKIDTTTTSKDDIENNLIRGQIIIRPNRSKETIEVEF